MRKIIIVTGGAGFVGSNLAKSLILKGSKIYGLIKDPNKDSLLKFEKLNYYQYIYYNQPNNHAYPFYLWCR